MLHTTVKCKRIVTSFTKCPQHPNLVLFIKSNAEGAVGKQQQRNGMIDGVLHIKKNKKNHFYIFRYVRIHFYSAQYKTLNLQKITYVQ